MLPEGLAPYVVLELSMWQLYGLLFLLGSFAVATLSDVKHLHAQREFVEVWALVVLAFLALEVWETWQAGWVVDPAAAVKWGVLLVFTVLSHREVGVLFRLARGDLAACVAACALLPAALVVLFWILLKVLSVLAQRVLGRGRFQYPFMPVVTMTTLAIVGLGRWGLQAWAWF